MAEDDAGERTEDATPKRREEAADEGRGARSQEAGIAAAILAAAAAVKLLADDAGVALRDLMGRGLASAGTIALDDGSAVQLLRHTVTRMAASGAAILLTIAGATFFVAAMQSGLRFTPKALKFHWERLDPAKNAQRLLSPTQAVETVKALLKVVVVGLLVWKALESAFPSTSVLSQAGPATLAPWIAEYVGRLLLTVGIAYAAIGGADYAWQRFQFEKGLRMSKEDVKRESKEENGDPIIRSARRRMAREMAFGQMMQDVAKASVVVTNPTHIAVAIRYDDDLAPVPVVLAMGQDKVAERIKAIAAEHQVPIVENVPIARALFKSAKVGSVIPVELYLAVAEILAYVYKTRQQRGLWRGSARA